MPEAPGFKTTISWRIPEGAQNEFETALLPKIELSPDVIDHCLHRSLFLSENAAVALLPDFPKHQHDQRLDSFRMCWPYC